MKKICEKRICKKVLFEKITEKIKISREKNRQSYKNPLPFAMYDDKITSSLPKLSRKYFVGTVIWMDYGFDIAFNYVLGRIEEWIHLIIRISKLVEHTPT